MDIDEYTSFDWGMTYLTGGGYDLQPRTLRYMMRPHSMASKDYFKYYNETMEGIKKFLHTKADLVPVTGPGRAAMDMALQSFCEPRDKVLFIENGYWGRYPADIMARIYDLKSILLTFDAAKAMDLDAVEKTLKGEKNIKAVHVVHVETEHGGINPIRQIGELVREHCPDSLYIVDSASAFPGNPIDVDKWNIDIDYFVSHKGFCGPSGLNFLSVNKKAWDVFKKRKTPPRSFMTSVKTWYDAWINCPNDGRHCLESFPTTILHAMRAKLDLMNIMGEAKLLKKNEIAGRAIRSGIRSMTEPPDQLVARGPMCKGCPGCDAPDPNTIESVENGRLCSQTMFTVQFPKRFPWEKFMDILENRFWLVAPHFGFGDSRKDGLFYSSNGFRIGFLREDQQIPRNIIAMITATGLGMRECGVKNIRWYKAVEKTVEIMKEYEDIGFTMYKWPHKARARS